MSEIYKSKYLKYKKKYIELNNSYKMKGGNISDIINYVDYLNDNKNTLGLDDVAMANIRTQVQRMDDDTPLNRFIVIINERLGLNLLQPAVAQAAQVAAIVAAAPAAPAGTAAAPAPLRPRMPRPVAPAAAAAAPIPIDQMATIRAAQAARYQAARTPVAAAAAVEEDVDVEEDVAELFDYDGQPISKAALYDRMQCRVCLVNVKTFAFIPCGHGACQRCSIATLNSATHRCPECRANVTSIQRIYFNKYLKL